MIVIFIRKHQEVYGWYRDEPDLDGTNNAIYFPADDNNNSISLNFKVKITGKTKNNDTKNVEITVPLISPLIYP